MNQLFEISTTRLTHMLLPSLAVPSHDCNVFAKKIIHQKNKHFLQDQLKDRQNNRSRLCDLPSTWSKCQSGATSTRIPFSTITGRNSQHTANVSPHFLCLLRQPRGSIRSSRVPTRGENDKHVLAYSTVMGRTFQISFLLMFTERHSILLV
jgi:hypothetical protein